MTGHPSARDALFELVDAQEFAGRTATAYTQLQVDYEDVAVDGAAVLIYTTGGTKGHIDRVDRATIEVYAPGELAVQVLEAISAAIVDQDHDTAAGYIDDVQADVVPHEIPYASDRVNHARATFLVESRPQ